MAKKDGKATHTVVHGNLYLAVGGKLQHVEKGTPVVLSDEQAKVASKDIYAPIGGPDTVDLSEDAKKPKSETGQA